MKYGLTTEQWEYLSLKVIQPLKAYGLRVFIFGSRARGDHHPYSDVDLMIEGQLTAVHEQAIYEMRETLSNSNFPMKVDLVVFAQFAKSYIPNYLSERVEL